MNTSTMYKKNVTEMASFVSMMAVTVSVEHSNVKLEAESGKLYGTSA